MEVAPSIQQTTYEHYQNLIKEQSERKPELLKTISEILEHQSLNTFSEFLSLKEIDEVRNYSAFIPLVKLTNPPFS